MPDAAATAAPPEVVVIDGREFAVGDLVLVEYDGAVGGVFWFAGTIAKFRRYMPFPVCVSPASNRMMQEYGDSIPCRVSEVHSFRENFA